MFIVKARIRKGYEFFMKVVKERIPREGSTIAGVKLVAAYIQPLKGVIYHVVQADSMENVTEFFLKLEKEKYLDVEETLPVLRIGELTELFKKIEAKQRNQN